MPCLRFHAASISPLIPSLGSFNLSARQPLLRHRRASGRAKTSPMALQAPPKKVIPGIKCMASERRVKMVAKQIWREISDMLLTDEVLQFAIMPEASLGADSYLSSVTTVSDVVVSGDLQVVKVYVSIFGDRRGREVAMNGLKSKAKYVRSQLGRRMRLRLTPQIHFIEDESIERGSRVIAILDRLKEESENSENQNERQSDPSNPSPEDQDWDPDDPDEGIIYVD